MSGQRCISTGLNNERWLHLLVIKFLKTTKGDFQHRLAVTPITTARNDSRIALLSRPNDGSAIWEAKMRIRSLAIVATSALLTLTAIGTASAQVVTTQSRIVSDGFTTCKTVRQTASDSSGSSSSVSKRVCRSDMGFPGPSPIGGLGGGGGFGGGGGRGGGGININLHF